MNKYYLNRKRAKDLNHILKVFRVLRLAFPGSDCICEYPEGIWKGGSMIMLAGQNASYFSGAGKVYVNKLT